ncbi:GtrA family protein [Pontivivens ytuae]|uniref:GtrA family protein n=1 Tax=Pontivivens ytuae TaxID=2789856 RepID=A0A7S9LQ44_9RHOB|nr:GtrA family protein [Pontivivens ytuae]QPH53074.1 GtrA family protein [Pontivivens ytuae]
MTSFQKRRLHVLTRREFWRLVRFGVVGVCLAATYAGLFLGLREFGLTRWESNGIAFSISTALQYVAHTKWTFQSRIWDTGQQTKFLVVIGIGVVYSFIVTTKLTPFFGWPDWGAAACVIFTLPILNYILYRFWVFRV